MMLRKHISEHLLQFACMRSHGSFEDTASCVPTFKLSLFDFIFIIFTSHGFENLLTVFQFSKYASNDKMVNPSKTFNLNKFF